MNKLILSSTEEVYITLENCTICEVRENIITGKVKLIPNGNSHTFIFTSERIILVPADEYSKLIGTIVQLAAKGVSHAMGTPITKKTIDIFLRNEGFDLYGKKELPRTALGPVVPWNERVLIFAFNRRKAPDFRNSSQPDIGFLFNNETDTKSLYRVCKSNGLVMRENEVDEWN